MIELIWIMSLMAPIFRKSCRNQWEGLFFWWNRRKYARRFFLCRKRSFFAVICRAAFKICSSFTKAWNAVTFSFIPEFKDWTLFNFNWDRWLIAELVKLRAPVKILNSIRIFILLLRSLFSKWWFTCQSIHIYYGKMLEIYSWPVKIYILDLLISNS